MRREANIPLFLWIATAVLVHLLSGGGVDQVARVLEETRHFRAFTRAVRAQLTAQGTLEVSMVDEPAAAPPEPPARLTADPSTIEANKAPVSQLEKRKPEQKTAEKPELKRPKPEPQKTPEPAPKKVELKPEPVKPLAQPPPELQKRIAVRQVPQKRIEDDNQSAALIADEANRVAEQTQARITSTDQNAPDPTPGGTHVGPKEPGNGEEQRVAQSEERKGERNVAPDEKLSQQRVAPAQLNLEPQVSQSTVLPEPASAGQPRVARAVTTPQAGPSLAKAPAPIAENSAPSTPSSPEVIEGGNAFTVLGPRQALVDQNAQTNPTVRLPPVVPRSPADLMGLGAPGATGQGVNINLSPALAAAAIGVDQLTRELRNDGERRLSAHRGSWRSSGLSRWRSAIENYVPMVKPGNQTALNTARVPFASYLNAIHNRIHPIFADSFLGSLERLPGTHPMNRQGITTNLEIVLDQTEGRIVRMGVTKSSGVTAFDVSALDSVQRASPFGSPPSEIVSPDGNVYFHWEFHRDPNEACSTYFARPFILKVPPHTVPPELTPPRFESPSERHGSLLLPVHPEALARAQ